MQEFALGTETKPHMKQHCCCTRKGHPRLAIPTAVAAEITPKDDDVSCRACFVSDKLLDPKLMMGLSLYVG